MFVNVKFVDCDKALVYCKFFYKVYSYTICESCSARDVMLQNMFEKLGVQI